MAQAYPEWIEYNDGRLAVRVPGNLRQHKSMLLFQAPKKARGQHTLTMFSALVLDGPDQIEAMRSNIETYPSRPIRVPEADYEIILVKREKPTWLNNGLLFITANRSLSTNAGTHSLGAIFDCSSLTVDVTAVTEGDPTEFERVVRLAIESIRPVRADEAPTQSPKRRAPVGLNRADKARLSQALEDLPAELEYLRKPILAIARQDQDLLGSGEADLGPIERALKKVAKGGSITRTAASHAELLRRWLTRLDETDSPWAAPLGFVQGALMGCSLFQSEAE